MASNSRQKVIVGEVYPTNNGGSLLVERYFNHKEVSVKFLDTGFKTITQAGHIIRGTVRDKMRPSVFGVGFEGVGPYKYRDKGCNTSCKVVWKSMLERCYCPTYHKRAPHYIVCSVDVVWHNFQNFAKWWEDNVPGDYGAVRYHLDKDKRVPGNRVYSPETCCFLTMEENISLSKIKDYTFVSPKGEVVHIRNMTSFAKRNGLTRENMSKIWRGLRDSHKGWVRYEETPPEQEDPINF